MGHSSYDPGIHKSTMRSFAASGTDPMTHHTTAMRTGVMKVHERLDPKTPNKAGEIIRESRDSADHPNSVAIAVVLDNTGSMGGTPREVLKEMPQLMAAIVKQGVADPHVLFGAIGDCTNDRVILQMGQFEAGNELDEYLSLFILEGGGGGSSEESYELAMGFLTEHAKMDCLEKRGKKGYLFILGDETPYPFLKAHEALEIYGAKMQGDKPILEVIKDLQEKFEVFWLMPRTSGYCNEHGHVFQFLKKTFAQRFIILEKTTDLNGMIAGIIGAEEGNDTDDILSGLAAVGIDSTAVASVSRAIATYTGGTSKTISKAVVTDGKLAVDGKDSVGKL